MDVQDFSMTLNQMSRTKLKSPPAPPEAPPAPPRGSTCSTCSPRGSTCSTCSPRGSTCSSVPSSCPCRPPGSRRSSLYPSSSSSSSLWVCRRPPAARRRPAPDRSCPSSPRCRTLWAPASGASPRTLRGQLGVIQLLTANRRHAGNNSRSQLARLAALEWRYTGSWLCFITLHSLPCIHREVCHLYREVRGSKHVHQPWSWRSRRSKLADQLG